MLFLFLKAGGDSDGNRLEVKEEEGDLLEFAPNVGGAFEIDIANLFLRLLTSFSELSALSFHLLNSLSNPLTFSSLSFLLSFHSSEIFSKSHCHSTIFSFDQPNYYS